MISKECAAYLSKNAQLGFLEQGKKFLGTAGPYVLGVPLVAGLGAGYMLSRGTSPSDAQTSVMKKEIIRSELEEELALTTREAAMRKLRRRMAAKLGRRDLI